VRLLEPINRAIVVLSAIALLVASCVLTYSVVLRYFSPEPTDWQDEFSVFLLIGVTFMSAAWVQSQRGHIGIEAVASLLPPAADRWRLRLVEGYVSSSSWAPPLWIPYSTMALGMSLLTAQIVLQIFRRS
jgi:TRAP-type C4-dicarboxylate transport system permease small subunit